MYQHYFGFKERPFQLVPNPVYLFLSRSHEEAMAHLTYAISEGDGFIAIIGEVGTGKTTLCRAFIENLDDRREVAYIFNPKLTAVELLKAVCDEFGIHVVKDGTTKDLNDALNRFLLEKRAEGKQVMLIIDEAQKLSRNVLDQLRLLSNLETNTDKLLQIVLVGQPELDDLLKSYELRQLNQRITLSCHLTPLTFQESVQYIQYRIRIAARNQGVAFTKSAFRKIYNFSGGIPRLIHIVCDRSLLTCFVKNREKISGSIVDSAIRELRPRENVKRLRVFEKRKTALLATMLAAMLILLMITFFTLQPEDSGLTPETDPPKIFKAPIQLQKENPPATSAGTRTDAPASSEPTASPVPETSPEPPEKAASSTVPEKSDQNQVTVAEPARLADLLAGIGNTNTIKSALSGALALWGADLPIKEYQDKELIDPETYFNLTARRNGFLVHRMQSNRSYISKLNLPAIFEFTRKGAARSYFLTLRRISDETLEFLAPLEEEPVEVSPDEVDRLWTGLVYVPWNNFYGYKGVTPITGGEQGIRTLKRILGEIGYHHLTPDPVYDSETESAVKEIQLKYGLPVDGLVGPLTKMILYNELPELDIPHIRGNDSNSL